MRPLTLTPFALLALLFFASPLTAHADALRCGSRIVVISDSQEQLRSVCGEPTSVQQQRILAPQFYTVNGRRYRIGEEFIEVTVEFWTYNFGPQKLMRRVRIEDGVVTDMETLGYGYN